MEFKKKTIIWEDNNEPPKNYIWVKSDGNAYEFNLSTKQWEKIMSSNGSGDDGGGGEGDSESSNVFFSPIPIQPSYFATENENNEVIILDIKNVNIDTVDPLEGEFLYSKESLVNIGVNEEGLNNLEQISYLDTFEAENESKALKYIGLKGIIEENNLIHYIQNIDYMFNISKFTFSNGEIPVIFKIGDNIYRIATISKLG